MAILWLHQQNQSANQRFILENYLNAADINPAEIFYITLHSKIQNLWIRKSKTKNVWVCNQEKKKEFFKNLDEYITKLHPKIIVINDRATLGFLLGQQIPSIDLCRSSVYRYKNIPCVVIQTVTAANRPIVKAMRHGPWLLLNDLRKLKRWHDDEKRREPKFRYSVARIIEDIKGVEKDFEASFILSSDIESVGTIITCIGFTYITHAGKVHSFVVPFFNPLKSGNCHWENEKDEIYAWQFCKKVLENSAYKVFQNGSYDCAHFLAHRIAVNNYLLDTQHFFHSIWPESPKKLNFIASITNDHCRYWKDERKGEKDEKIPQTKDGLERYWRYNALDCYNTLLAAIWLLKQIVKENLRWALSNYSTEFSLQVGPALAMSMTGMLTNIYRRRIKNIEWMEQYKDNLKKLRIMVDQSDFSPNSPDQVAQLIYDVLGARPIKTKGKKKYGDRSVDENILKLIKVQNPLFALFINQIWATKKPANNSKKYGEMRLLNGRFMYQYGAAGTKFGRFNGKEHQYWIGTNPQNIPKKARDMLVADPGHVLIDLDYRQSDNWFIAFECEDPKMIENISDDRDTHLVHAEFFFKIPYEKLYQAHLNKEDWTDHPTNGIRQNTKRIVHGCNYRMAGFTLYMTLGHEATVATAKALGYKDAHLWPRSRLVDLCGHLLQNYLHLYVFLPKWFQTSVEECVKNGNLATCAFGRTHLFFGDLGQDEAIQRELSSFYGQGGTSGNINRTLNTVYYESDLMQEGLMLLLQTHDSITSQIPEEKLHLVNKFLTIMEAPCTIKDRTFTVPVDATIGYTWEKSMIPWREDITINEVKRAEEKFSLENYSIIT